MGTIAATGSDRLWGNGLRYAEDFVDIIGHARIPAEYVTAEGFALGRWAQRQRVEYRKGLLAPERAQALEFLPGWAWSVHHRTWQIGFERLLEFFAEKGHTRVPARWKCSDGYCLGSWVRTQRRKNAAGQLDSNSQAALERVPGWGWDAGGTALSDRSA